MDKEKRPSLLYSVEKIEKEVGWIEEIMKEGRLEDVEMVVDAPHGTLTTTLWSIKEDCSDIRDMITGSDRFWKKLKAGYEIEHMNKEHPPDIRTMKKGKLARILPVVRPKK